MYVDTTELTAEVNDYVAAQAAERQARRQARQLQRAIHAERRRLGMEGRHRRKLAQLRASLSANGGGPAKGRAAV